ncbi:hypothetical protein [Streptomyces stelliscabiei]|uniref:hypothetical protein n=1 Tax=Streptomyces stelliscabiei TaxID=146820 RepID=UPI0029AA736F|nr:hypothetical protein [Streptomyces stelliscabiei]MDX2550103.1 hypothetical protein [Streptomyces stelliscabiei]
MSDDVQRMLTEIQFFHLVREESKRTILCEPHREHQVRAAVDQAGAADILTVRPSAACPTDKLIVIDENALDAGLRESAQRGPMFPSMRWFP